MALYGSGGQPLSLSLDMIRRAAASASPPGADGRAQDSEHPQDAGAGYQSRRGSLLQQGTGNASADFATPHGTPMTDDAGIHGFAGADPGGASAAAAAAARFLESELEMARTAAAANGGGSSGLLGPFDDGELERLFGQALATSSAQAQARAGSRGDSAAQRLHKVARAKGPPDAASPATKHAHALAPASAPGAALAPPTAVPHLDPRIVGLSGHHEDSPGDLGLGLTEDLLLAADGCGGATVPQGADYACDYGGIDSCGDGSEDALAQAALDPAAGEVPDADEVPGAEAADGVRWVEQLIGNFGSDDDEAEDVPSPVVAV